jgi:hypothetical protein
MNRTSETARQRAVEAVAQARRQAGRPGKRRSRFRQSVARLELPTGTAVRSALLHGAIGFAVCVGTSIAAFGAFGLGGLVVEGGNFGLTTGCVACAATLFGLYAVFLRFPHIPGSGIALFLCAKSAVFAIIVAPIGMMIALIPNRGMATLLGLITGAALVVAGLLLGRFPPGPRKPAPHDPDADGAANAALVAGALGHLSHDHFGGFDGGHGGGHH